LRGNINNHGLDDETEVIFVDPDKKKAWLPLTDDPHYDIR
jgi:hypothetical protein